ncbi:Dedicator of cytokinesis protein 6 [Allomyces arbusculus]|nr:Dedicator of cytokinesis protein 6 [Allomyces arbusculus]
MPDASRAVPAPITIPKTGSAANLRRANTSVDTFADVPANNGTGSHLNHTRPGTGHSRTPTSASTSLGPSVSAIPAPPPPPPLVKTASFVRRATLTGKDGSVTPIVAGRGARQLSLSSNNPLSPSGIIPTIPREQPRGPFSFLLSGNVTDSQHNIPDLSSIKAEYQEQDGAVDPHEPLVSVKKALALEPLQGHVKQPLVSKDHLNEWSASSHAVMTCLEAHRCVVKPLAPHLADYRPLLPSAEEPKDDEPVSPSTDVDKLSQRLFVLSQDHVWAERTVPEWRRCDMLSAWVPGPWLELALDRCAFPDFVQPLFVQMTVFHQGYGTRLTETFHCETNVAGDMHWLELVRGAAAFPTDKARGLLPMSMLHDADAVLVVKVDRILDKAIDNTPVTPTLKKLAPFRQTWAYAAIPLASLASAQGQVAITTVHVRKHPSTMAQFLQAMIGNATSNPAIAKSIDADIRIRIEKNVQHAIDPVFLPDGGGCDALAVPKRMPKDHEPRPTIMRPFDSAKERLHLSSRIRHELLLFPLSLAIKRGKGRNMVVDVEVCNGKGEPILCVAGRSGEPAWRFSASTNVMYHEKTPTFEDEIKCRLMPTKEKLHLRFVFSHVACKDKNPAVLTPCGFAFLPLQDDTGKYIDDLDYTLPVYQGDFKDGKYLTSGGARNGNESVKDVFKVRLQVDSSFIFQDKPLFTLLEGAGAADAAVANIMSANAKELTSAFPVVLNYLMAYLQTPGIPAPQTVVALNALIHTVNTVHSEAVHSGSGSPLVQWVRADMTADGVHEALLRAWCGVLEAHALVPPNSPAPNAWNDLGLGQSWFLFGAIVKSMTLAVGRQGSLGNQGELTTLLKRLVDLLTPFVLRKATAGLNLAKDLNNNLAYFVRDLILLVPIELVLDLVLLHVNAIDIGDSATLASIKTEFLAHVAGSEHPFPLDQIVTEVVRCLVHTNREIRVLGITMWRDVLVARSVIATSADVAAVWTGRPSVDAHVLYYFASVTLTLLPSLLPQTSTEVLVMRTVALCTIFSLMHLVKHPRFASWAKQVLDDGAWMQRLMLLLNEFQYGTSEQAEARLVVVQQRGAGGAKKFLEDYFKSHVSTVRGKLGRPGTAKTDTASVAASQRVSDQSVAQEMHLSAHIAHMVLRAFDELTPVFPTSRGTFLEFLIQALWIPVGEEGAAQVLSRIATMIEADPVIILERYTEPLIDALLRTASNVAARVRSAAGHVLFTMFRTCYSLQARDMKHGRAFSQFRIQVTVAISQLRNGNMEHLAQCWDEIASKCAGCTDAGFREKMLSASQILSAVIRNGIRLETIPDLESRIDCYGEIAKGYCNTPDLRLATLETIGNIQADAGYLTEAALAYLHAAALISEYLFMQNVRYPGPKGAKAFAACNPNLVEEVLPVTIRDEGAFSSDEFSEDGLITFLDRAVPLLHKAAQYEMVNEVYKLLVPILEARRDWARLAAAHQQLADAFSVLSHKPARIFATYYRVAYIGAAWGELNGKAFVYREKGMCMLPDFATKLRTNFASMGDTFQILQESGTIDESKLDPAKAYAQVTHVDAASSSSSSNSNDGPTTKHADLSGVRQFTYMVPFTPSGKTHGDVSTQWLKHVHVATRCPFPSWTKRHEIVNVTTTDLNPLQVSTQAIAARTARLRSLVHAAPVDTKSLQMVLSGSLRPQVNSGPGEIARVFLGASGVGSTYPTSQVEELKAAFRLFLRVCEVAVTVNRQLIHDDQLDYQKDLELGYEQLVAQLEPLLQANVGGTAHSPISPQKIANADAHVKQIVEFLGSQENLAAFLLE